MVAAERENTKFSCQQLNNFVSEPLFRHIGQIPPESDLKYRARPQSSGHHPEPAF